MSLSAAACVDVVLLCVGVEAAVLLVLRRFALLPTLLSGFMLLLALRASLAEFGVPVLAACLLLSLLAHLADLRARFSPRPRP